MAEWENQDWASLDWEAAFPDTTALEPCTLDFSTSIHPNASMYEGAPGSQSTGANTQLFNPTPISVSTIDNPPTCNTTPASECKSGSSTSSASARKDTPATTPASSTGRKSRVEKREANTLAARRYRQARLDRLAELEAALKETQAERDELKVQVAKLQGENQVLKGLVCGTSGLR